MATTWNSVIEDDNDAKFDLYSKDKSHPAWNGSYLMACVIFSTVFQENCTGLEFYRNLPIEIANSFQLVASNIVLDNLTLWNIISRKY